jgi:hypothetical protein
MSKDFRFLSTVNGDFNIFVGNIDLSLYIVFVHNSRVFKIGVSIANTCECFANSDFFVILLES